MTVFDAIYKWARRGESPATTVYERNCVGHIYEDFVGYVVKISRIYKGEEIYANKRFANFENARHFATSMTAVLSNFMATDMVSPISGDLVIQCWRSLLFRKIRTLLFPLTTKFGY